MSHEEDNYYNQYLKYKHKYIAQKTKIGGTITSPTYYYHGTKHKITTTTLEPHPSPLVNNNHVVFATNTRWLALIFIAGAGDSQIELGFTHNIPYIYEVNPGAFNKYLKGQSGFIHYVDPAPFRRDERLGMHNHEFITDNPVPILKTEKIADIYEALKSTEVNIISYDIQWIMKDKMDPEGIMWDDVTPNIRWLFGKLDATVLEVNNTDTTCDNTITGKYANSIVRDVKRVYVVDTNKEAIERARLTTKVYDKDKIEYAVITNNKIPYPDHSIDVIMYPQSFHKMNMTKAIKEADRLLSEDGILIIMQSDDEFDDVRLNPEYIGFDRKLLLSTTHMLKQTKEFIESQQLFTVAHKKETDRLVTFVLKR